MRRKEKEVDIDILRKAFQATCTKRGTHFSISEGEEILAMIETNSELKIMWEQFKGKNYFVEKLNWETVVTYDVACIKMIMHCVTFQTGGT